MFREAGGQSKKNWKPQYHNKVFQEFCKPMEEEEFAKRGPAKYRKESYTILNLEKEKINENLKRKIKFPYPRSMRKSSEK